MRYLNLTIVSTIIAAANCCELHAGSGPHAGDINPVVAPFGAPRKGMVKIHMNAIEKDGTIFPNVRVFESDLGSEGVPGFTAEPGFDALPDTFLPGTRVGFHAPQGLFVFTGDGLAPVDTERLNVAYLTLQTTIGPSPNRGFDLAVQADGGWHRHLGYTILDTVEPLPAPGIYVLPMTLYSTDPFVVESDMFWLVFDYEAGQEAQDAAGAWILANLATSPCPADLDGDGTVGANDLGILLGAWGGTGSADLDGDGAVGAADLAILLGAWGTTCNG
ncbi:MAG: hypothetical protein U0572_14465 [Phycisphaerales bacterium]